MTSSSIRRSTDRPPRRQAWSGRPPERVKLNSTHWRRAERSLPAVRPSLSIGRAHRPGLLAKGRAVRGMARRSASARRPSFTRRWPTDGRTGFLGRVRKAADFQYRSGPHFHRRGFHQQACDGRRRDFDGRTRPLHGQHFHRTAVALDQVRRSASESLRRWLRGAVRHQSWMPFTIFGALTRR